MTILSASFFLALSSITMAEDYQVRTDTKIEAGAAARAAQRIGEIRGTIPYDRFPDIIKPTDLEPRKKLKQENSDLSPRPSWIAPDEDTEKLPPLVTREHLEKLDKTLTGSIEQPLRQRRSFEWEVFDENGNLVKID